MIVLVQIEELFGEDFFVVIVWLATEDVLDCSCPRTSDLDDLVLTFAFFPDEVQRNRAASKQEQEEDEEGDNENEEHGDDLMVMMMMMMMKGTMRK